MKVLVYPALEEWGDVADEFHGFELQPEFDALEALRTEGLLPPNPRVRPLDNLHKCRRILPTVSLSQFFTFFSLDCSYLHYQVQLNILQILLHLWPLQKELGGFLDVPPFPYQIYSHIYIQESSQNFILT